MSEAQSNMDGSSSELTEALYNQLRAIARRQLEGERRGHTLSATALVNEAFLKMAGNGPKPAAGREFYLAAAGAMRRILIDHARGRGAVKRGGGGSWKRLESVENVVDLADGQNPEDFLALDEAILRLEEEDPSAAGVVRLRFYAGLTGARTAEVLGISERQVDREWAFARAFLKRLLRSDSAD